MSWRSKVPPQRDRGTRQPHGAVQRPANSRQDPNWRHPGLRLKYPLDGTLEPIPGHTPSISSLRAAEVPSTIQDGLASNTPQGLAGEPALYSSERRSDEHGSRGGVPHGPPSAKGVLLSDSCRTDAASRCAQSDPVGLGTASETQGTLLEADDWCDNKAAVKYWSRPASAGREPFFGPHHVPTKGSAKYLRKYFKNKRRLELLLVLQRFARWYFVGVAAVHYVPRYPSSRQRREHAEYIVGLGGRDAYLKLLDSLTAVADGYDSEGEAWDVESDHVLGDEGGDGY